MAGIIYIIIKIVLEGILKSIVMYFMTELLKYIDKKRFSKLLGKHR